MKAKSSSYQFETIGLLSTAIALSVSGCVSQRVFTPTVMALPAAGESFDVFEQHEGGCRQYASAQIGEKSPGEGAAQSGIAGAAIGTGIGAAAGALLGSATGHAGGGAAVGAGTGLLTGTVLGSARGRNAAAAMQRQYNMAYTQCMVANGEHMASPSVSPALVYRVPPPRVIYVPAPTYTIPTPIVLAQPVPE
jgi:Glycine-zipper domain